MELKRSLIVLATTLPLFWSVSSAACEGTDYERTVQLYQESQQLDVECEMSDDPANCRRSSLAAAAEQLNGLPPSCREIFEQNAPPGPD